MTDETMIRGADFKIGDAINVWTAARPNLITAIRPCLSHIHDGRPARTLSLTGGATREMCVEDDDYCGGTTR